MEMLVAEPEADYTRHLARNLVIGLIAAYAATIGICYAGLRELDTSAAIAVVPALFAGPYVGIMMTLVGAHKRQHSPAVAADTGALAVGAPAPAAVS
jgi:hypothetical protein